MRDDFTARVARLRATNEHLRATLDQVVKAYDAYSARGGPAPVQYVELVKTIEAARAALISAAPQDSGNRT